MGVSRHIGTAGRVIAPALMAWSVLASPQSAAAQGLFEALFGRPSYNRPAPLPPQTSSYADPGGPTGREPSQYGTAPASSSGHGMVYCVRTCDGRYFPLQHHAGASPAELCKSFCPSAQTMTFSGSKIDSAVAPNGTRYADLDNAFVYRDRVVDNCSCNGKERLGLARVSAVNDPTLRAGDIVATNDGLVNFRGKSSNAAAEFTPIDTSRGAWTQKLSEIKVRPAPPQVAVAPVEDNTPTPARKKTRAQASR